MTSKKKEMIIKALIPARSGSKRIPGKNIRLLRGVPLLAYSVATAGSVPEITGVYVSTDSAEYAQIAKQWGAQVIKRPKKLCADDVRDQPVIAHALKTMSPVDLIVYLRPTTPLRSVETVRRAITTFISAGESATGLRSVHEMSESAYKCCELRLGYIIPIRGSDMAQLDTPNQLVAKTFHPNGYVDIAKRAIIDSGSLFGPNMIGFITHHIPEIDTEDDWLYAEWWVDRVKVYG